MKHKGITKDPVCGMRLNRNKAYVAIKYKGNEYLLCCPLCQSEFERNPEKYTATRKNRRSVSIVTITKYNARRVAIGALAFVLLFLILTPVPHGFYGSLGIHCSYI